MTWDSGAIGKAHHERAEMYPVGRVGFKSHLPQVK
jgi:hypothetical protein